MGILLLSLGSALAAEVARPGCPTRTERLDLLEAGEAALVEADFGTVETKLRALEGAYSCGPVVETELLGRMWLLEGAWLTLQGDAAGGAESFRAAARVAPATWLTSYGAALRSSYEQAIGAPAAGTTTLSVTPQVFRYVGLLDGQKARFPATVAPGLHLVQVGPSDQDVHFSRIVAAVADTPVVVETGLTEPTTTGAGPAGAPAPAPGAKPPKPPKAEKAPVVHPPLALHAGVGVAVAVGPDPEGAEAGTKVAFPLETGIVVRPRNAVWTRAVLTAGPLAGGAFAYDAGGEPVESPALLGANLAGGFAARAGDLGLLAGWQWPGRVAVRGVLAGAPPTVPVRAEARIGLNLGRGAPETAVDLALAFTPRLQRDRAER